MQKSSSSKTHFHRQFSNAARPTKSPYFDLISRDQATVHVNEAIADLTGPVGHRAVEEIRSALMLLGGAGGIGGMCMEIIDNKNTEGFSEWAVEVWRRFSLWYRINEFDPHMRHDRDSAILFAQGERPRAIERKLKLRNGTAKEKIRGGVWDYCLMAGWVRPREP